MSGSDRIASRIASAWHRWGAGLLVATLAAAGLLWLAGRNNETGWMLLGGVPAVVGLALGYGLRVHRGARMVLALLTLFAVVGGVIFLGLGGLLCGAIFVCLAGGPAVVAVLVGSYLRSRLDPDDSYDLRDTALYLLLVLAVGGAMELEGRLAPRFAPETVVTRRVLEMTPAEAWERLVFYEEVPRPPALLVRLRLPLPLGTEGRIARAGDVKLCLYATGHLRKRVTDLAPGRLLAFDVTEQVGVEDGSAELLSGSFRFVPAGAGRTEVVLATTYRPLLQARAAWRPFERAVAHLLHRQVLDGMEMGTRSEPRLMADSGVR